MMRLTLDEYSKHFKMSKEMINSKLRAKKLNYIIENGTTYIIVTRSSLNSSKIEEIHKEKKTTSAAKSPAKPKTTVAMVISLYQKENQQLKEKIVQLEAKIDKLIDDKEKMLRDEMSKIEQVYSAKDEHLKTILELINTKLLAEQSHTIHEVETLERAKVNEVEKKDEIVELKEYLKTLDLEPYQRKIIKKRFLSVYDKDIRIIKQNGKLYLNFSKYDYTDLLAY
jgi:small-conductance mechanosensitive channel